MSTNPDKRLELTEDQLDELADKEYRDYLESIGAIRVDGTIDRSKLDYRRAQTFEELEALLWEKENPTDG